MTGRGRYDQPGYINNNPFLKKKKKDLYGGKHDYHFLRFMVCDSIIFKGMELTA